MYSDVFKSCVGKCICTSELWQAWEDICDWFIWFLKGPPPVVILIICKDGILNRWCHNLSQQACKTCCVSYWDVTKWRHMFVLWIPHCINNQNKTWLNMMWLWHNCDIACSAGLLGNYDIKDAFCVMVVSLPYCNKANQRYTRVPIIVNLTNVQICVCQCGFYYQACTRTTQ